MDKKFLGFRSPKYTQVPDELFDELLSQLNESELKTLLYVVRRTFGFKKDSDNISIAQICKGIKTKEGKILDRGTGLGKSSVARAIKGLEGKNIIIARRRKNQKKGFLPTSYSLNIIKLPLSQNETRAKKVVPLAAQGLVPKRDTQKTVLQDIDNNVNVTQYPKKPEYEIKDLINQMEEKLQDNHSRAFYKKIAAQYSSEVIYQALSITKDMDHQKQIKKSKAAFFTGLIKTIEK
ncbi:MAG: hypothetical protein GH144_10335 [Clostridia bacterium]|jgi:hypothetical protein|nr:hypothetical protein [Clostridia bacterium]